MREITDIRSGWKYAVCDYPEGVIIKNDPWNPSAHSSMWDKMTQVPAHSEWENVDLPHIWNKDNASAAGPRLYEKELILDAPGEDNQYFLAFGGVFGLCYVFLNGRIVGKHKGGYTRFCVDLTKAAVDGINTVTVFTDNTVVTDITPLSGDFAKYGGIYRETELIRVGMTHFDNMYYGSKGVLVDTEPDGTTKVKALVRGGENAELRFTITDAEGNVAAQAVTRDTEAVLKAANVIRWNGKQNPYLYRFTAQLFQNGTAVDEVSFQIGYRDVRMTADRGFFLNGRHVPICGVAKHQDRKGCGPAATNENMEEDMSLIKEVGANAVRLSHYQHPQFFYDLCDQEGILVWAEIPMLSMPDSNPYVMENARSQLFELLMQNRHHASIVFWGIQNEVAIMGETLGMNNRVRDLNRLVKELKPDAITASANEYTVKPKSELNGITDIQGYNLYYGWYYGEFDDLGTFFDNFHKVRPDVPIGISEYGVDCAITLHQAHPKRQDYSEEYQCAFHEHAYPIIRAKEWVWGSFIWNMFEFCSPHRGFEPLYGLNRKGLVTFDRKVRKDAFYYYKAWWSEEPFVHLCEKRYAKRVEQTTVIKIYSNQSTVSLEVNGENVGSVSGNVVFRFEGIRLKPGTNRIVARAGDLADLMEIERVEEAEKSYVYVDPNPGFQVRDWVTGSTKSEDLFPDGKCSILDEMRELAQIPEAWALLEREIPDIAVERMKHSGNSVLRAINRVSSKFKEAFVKELNKKLNEIDKPELDG